MDKNSIYYVNFCACANFDTIINTAAAAAATVGAEER
jgi:uncharacterized membrane protein